jgi:glyoxylase-like metal-dependent hydrolase (beta-lactamase superfamily II)
MNRLAAGISYTDLNFQQHPRIIASVVLHGSGRVALIDPGPSSTLPTLKRELAAGGLAIGDVDTLLLTHIHLDHAGASGTLVRENPRLRVFVHEKGASHLENPERLLASASRLYGDQMDRLWGEVLAVPGEAITLLCGGERIAAGGRALDVAYTPGHASHHVSYFDADSGLAFVGDTAGVKVLTNAFVLPPTPPPDIDIELWRESLSTIARWRPDTLFLTHFGPSGPPAEHLAELNDHLDWEAKLVKDSLARDAKDSDREAWFTEQVATRLRQRLSEDDVRSYEMAAKSDLNWRGLARYWRKKTSR